MCKRNVKDVWELLVFKALFSISFLGEEKKKKEQISKVSAPPGTMMVTFLQFPFTIYPFPLDVTQGDTMRHQEVAGAGGSRERMRQQHSAVPRMREALGWDL